MVDRPGVEVLQGMELTGTNRSRALLNTISRHVQQIYITFYVVFRVQTLTDSVAIATRVHLFPSRTQ